MACHSKIFGMKTVPLFNTKSLCFKSPSSEMIARMFQMQTKHVKRGDF